MRRVLFTLLILSCLPLHAQINLSNGLMAYYPFNGSFNDVSGAGHHGKGMNGVGYGTDQWGNPNGAAYFDGIDDYISIAASPGITFSGTFSIAFRFLTTSTALQVLMSKSDWTGAGAPDNFQYQIGINGGSVLPSNSLFFATSHKASCITSTFFASHYSYGTNANNNQWYCVVLTFENGLKKVYMNGSLISSTTITGTSLNNAIDSCPGGTLRIGSWWQNDPRWFKGLIDDVRIYNRALSALEADSLCNLKPESNVVINKYAAITGLEGNCSNGFKIDDATGFAAGDTVLMIQMQGAAIDSSNTSTFGQVLAMNGAGNYEYNIIQAISGNVTTLRNQIRNSYDIPAGRVQFVQVPSYVNYTVSQPHTCIPWNGSKGGVFAIRVSGTHTLNAPISVSGAGFQGGQPLLSSRASCNKTDYYYPSTNNEGGQKGEGIATISASKQYGRGRLANGGGGGNDNNAGGGGGGTYGAGGQGGQQYNAGACATDLAIGGIGGMLNTANRAGRLLMGGGGGAGHGNEKAEKAGGAGGGILILDVAAISSNGQPVSANGADAPQCSAPGNPGGGCMNDAGGGGGAGGHVLITAASINGSLPINARGGKGSDVYLGNGVTPSGPGGGGGGGQIAVIASTSGRTVQNVSGGANGMLPQLGIAYGAQAGSAGQSLSSSAIPFASTPYTSTAVKPSFRDSLIGCLSHQLFNTTVPAVQGPMQASWEISGVGRSAADNPVFVFPAYGNYELILWVTDANGCRDSIHRTLVVSQPVGISMDSTFCAGSMPELTARAGTAYAWFPAQTLSSPSTRSVRITDLGRNDSATRSYRVLVTIGPGCNISDTFNVTVHPAPIAAFSFRPDPPQTNRPVVFTNESRNDSARIWNFGDGSGSDEMRPSHLFMQTRTFDVCLIAISNKGCPDTACKEVQADYQQRVAVPTGFSPNNDGNNDVLRVKGGPFAAMKFAVYNRWGQVVFQTTNVTEGWDGNYKGAPQPVDVYAYALTVTFMDGTTQTIKGNVTLLR